MKIKDKSKWVILMLIILTLLGLYYFYTQSNLGNFYKQPTNINENIGFNKSTEARLKISNG